MSKKSSKTILIFILAIILGFGGYFSMYLLLKIRNKPSAKILNTNSQVVAQQQDNKSIDGVNLGVLTREQVLKAASLGEKYKERNIFTPGVNLKVRSEEQFKNSYVANIGIITPYIKVVKNSAELAKNYTEINENSIVNKLKDNQVNLNSLFCSATVGGDEPNFAKNDTIIIEVNNNDGTKKIIHPMSISNDIGNESTTDFSPYSPIYQNSISAEFDITGLNNIQSINVKVIQPTMPEVEENFNYDMSNQL